VDARLIYWTGALLNMAAVAGLSVSGVRARRRGDVAGHRRRMLVATALVCAFLASYALKLMLLGSEDPATWAARDVWVLRLHELCVLFMLVGGSVALWRGGRLRRTRSFDDDPAAPEAPAGLARGHRAAGWTAVVAAGLGLLTAALVLAGMYRRAGLL
jgi:uncharacterized membrane protein YozB (DUF420 family)